MAEVSREQDVTVVELDKTYDALDTELMQNFKDLLLNEVAAAEPPKVVIDMHRTEYVGSRFIELLFRTWKQLRDREGRMALCNLSPFCSEVMKTARLDKVWTMHPSRAEAVTAVQDGADA